MTRRVAIYVFPNVEVLDFAGPFEVFTTASRVQRRRNPEAAPPFEVATFARSLAPIQARAGLRILPQYDLATCPAPDVLLVPGGVVDLELQEVDLLRWIAATARSAEVTASVCTGAFLLAKAGLLTDRAATTHWEDLEDLRAAFPRVRVVSDRRWVDEGRVVTSAGIAAGIDMSLHIVARMAGNELAAATARQMDIPYRVAA